MVDVQGLKAEMVRKGLTQEKMAKHLNMSSRTFSSRLKRGVFGSDEIEKIMHILDIKNPTPIFFGQTVSFKDTLLK